MHVSKNIHKYVCINCWCAFNHGERGHYILGQLFLGCIQRWMKWKHALLSILKGVKSLKKNTLYIQICLNRVQIILIFHSRESEEYDENSKPYQTEVTPWNKFSAFFWAMKAFDWADWKEGLRLVGDVRVLAGLLLLIPLPPGHALHQQDSQPPQSRQSR